MKRKVEVVIKSGDFSSEEIDCYIHVVQSKLPKEKELSQLTLSEGKDGNVDIDYVAVLPKFERIRRITGYLVGTIDRWNDAKRAEEHDRVKHGIA
jgi:hypothetical protein